MPKSKKHNILIITYWSYKDALVQTYTLPYVKMIAEILRPNSKIYLFTKEQAHLSMNKTEWKAAKQQLAEQYNIQLLRSTYRYFGLLAILTNFFVLLRLYNLIWQKKIKTIHAWCTPAGAFAYILARFSGKRLIIDSFEPHAEAMLEAGVWKKTSLAFKILFYLEKKQAKRADALIACVQSMKDYIHEKYKTSPKEFYWKPVAVDFDLFSEKKKKDKALLKELGLENKTILVYAGKFGGSYLKKEVFVLIKAAYLKWEDNFRFLLLSNHPKTEIQEWMQEYKIQANVLIQRFVPHAQVPDYIGLGDFAIVPFIPVPSKRYGSPIKTAEYMAMGLPIIITKDISDDSDIIKTNHFGYVVENIHNIEEMTLAIEKIQSFFKENDLLSSKIVSFSKNRHNFNKAKFIYNKIYAKN